MASDDLTGGVIEFLDAGKLKLALVTGQAQSRLQVRDANGKQRRVAIKQVIVHHGPCAVDAFASRAVELEESIEAIQEEIDTELLWDAVQAEQRELEIEELADCYFDGREAPRVSALFRAVFSDPIHFRVKGRRILPRSAEQVEDQKNILRKREERRAFREESMRWLNGLFEREEAPAAVAATPEMERLLRAYEDYLWQGRDDPAVQWLEDVPALRARGKSARELVFEVLRRAGRVPADADRRLALAGIREAFPGEVLAEAERIEPFEMDPGRRDFRALTTFSIDDEDTTEIDDALTVRAVADRLEVGIHIADVAHFVLPDSLVDRDAHRRGASIYLPSRTVPMLPRRISDDLASLKQGALRPTVSFVVEFDASAAIVSREICRGVVVVDERLTYEEADARIAATASDALSEGLRSLAKLATELEERRRQAGAIAIRRRELKVRVGEDGAPIVKAIDTGTESRRLVSEMMILANSIAAEQAVAQGLPCIFRAQDPPDEPLQIPEQYDPVALDAIFRRLKRSRMSSHAAEHAGLGLSAYTQLTSPIRRYQDLAIQRQLTADLAGKPPVYDAQSLLQVLTTVQSVEGENRELERSATRFELLRYVAAELGDRDLDAQVILELRAGWLIELQELPVRGLLDTPGELSAGDRVRVRVHEVDPRRDVLTFKLAG